MVPADGAVSGRRIVFATRNEGKVSEMVALLADSSWTVERLPETVDEYEETGVTFAENARGKALHAAASVPLPVLADDSGLVVDALGGRPGVHSARFLGPEAGQPERNQAILRELSSTPPALRTARFVCHVALAYGGEIVHETTGVCEGSIADQAHGRLGFGYDPIFLDPETGKTFAQLEREEKSARSHRGRAVRAMADFLRAWRPN